MAKEKVTLTLDAEVIRELRTLVGARRLSQSVDAAVAAYVQRLRYGDAQRERARDALPIETQKWAARIVDQWEAERRGHRRRRAAVTPR